MEWYPDPTTGTCIPGVPGYSIPGYERWGQKLPIYHTAGFERRGTGDMGDEWRGEATTLPKTPHWGETRKQASDRRVLLETVRDGRETARIIALPDSPVDHRLQRAPCN